MSSDPQCWEDGCDTTTLDDSLYCLEHQPDATFLTLDTDTE
jgi:hypothetical protein